MREILVGLRSRHPFGHAFDALAGSVRTTWECVRAVRSEAQVAEGTVLMLINILIGSLGGLLVAEFVTASTVTPVAAAQAQVELAYVAKKIAFLGGKLNTLRSDVTKILDAVRGFRRIEAMRFVLAQLDYPGKLADVVGTPDPLIVGPPDVVAAEAGEHAG